MFKLFKPTSVSSLQRKYDKLMKEAYDLSKSNPDESTKKQKEAHEIHKQLIAKRVA
ncbi:MAG: Lacal_2735 family protein [Bacteroidota bacterium]